MNSTNPEKRVDIGADLIETEGDRVALRISACRACGERWFPSLVRCAGCNSNDMSVELSPSTGTVYASTVVRVGSGRFPREYTLSYVDVDGVRLLVHSDPVSVLEPATTFDLTVGQVGSHDGEPLSSYMIAPHAKEVTA